MIQRLHRLQVDRALALMKKGLRLVCPDKPTFVVLTERLP